MASPGFMKHEINRKLAHKKAVNKNIYMYTK